MENFIYWDEGIFKKSKFGEKDEEFSLDMLVFFKYFRGDIGCVSGEFRGEGWLEIFIWELLVYKWFEIWEIYELRELWD